jgi:hypothetical protein
MSVTVRLMTAKDYEAAAPMLARKVAARPVCNM